MVFRPAICQARRVWSQYRALGRMLRRHMLCGGQLPSAFSLGEVRPAPPVPLEFPPIPVRKIQGVNKVEMSLLRVRGTRWFGVQRLEALERSLCQVIDVEVNFNFRPYSHTPAGVLPNLMFLAQSVGT